MSERKYLMAMMFAGDPSARATPKLEETRLGDIAKALRNVGLDVEAAIYADEVADEVREGDGRIVDQAYQLRLTDGIVRCYQVGDRVAGFGEQLVNALYPAPPGASPADAPPPGPRLYYPPTRSDFQKLKNRLECEWLPEMCRVLSIDPVELPVIWDADFMYGPKNAAGEDTYVLCEINISSVYPFPDEALAPLAEEALRRLRARAR